MASQVILCLESSSLWVCISIFCVVFSLEILKFFHMVRSSMNHFFNWNIWLRDGILAGTTTIGESGPGSNINEGIHHTPQIHFLQIIYTSFMVFVLIFRHFTWFMPKTCLRHVFLEPIINIGKGMICYLKLYLYFVEMFTNEIIYQYIETIQLIVKIDV